MSGSRPRALEARARLIISSRDTRNNGKRQSGGRVAGTLSTASAWRLTLADRIAAHAPFRIVPMHHSSAAAPWPADMPPSRAATVIPPHCRPTNWILTGKAGAISPQSRIRDKFSTHFRRRSTRLFPASGPVPERGLALVSGRRRGPRRARPGAATRPTVSGKETVTQLPVSTETRRLRRKRG